MLVSTGAEHEAPLKKQASASRPDSCGSSTWDRVIPFLIFFACFAYLCIFLRHSTLEPDEGIVLQGAERVLHGELPYRDFFSFYTPGSFFLLAFLFRVFGDSFVVARVSLAVCGAICSVITYLLARRVCTHWISVFTALLATTAGAAFRFLVLHNSYSTLFACVAVYAAVRHVEKRIALWACAAGSLASLTFVFEQSKGAGLFGGIALGFMLLQFTRGLETPNFAMLVLGFSWPLLLTVMYFAAHQATGVMLQSWLWPLHHYTQANHVPYGFQNWSDQSRTAIFHSGPLLVRAVQILLVSSDLLFPVLPLVSLGLLVYWSMRIFRGNGPLAESRYYIMACSILSGLLASVVIVRPDILHFMYLAPLWYVILAWILGSTGARNRLLLAARPILTAYTIAAFGLLSMALLSLAVGTHKTLHTARGILMTSEKEDVLTYLQTHTTPGQELLVYPYLPLYNYLSATRSPSPLDYFQPGMNTPGQGAEIITSLNSGRPVPVLFEPWFPEKFANSWPDTPLAAIANDPVADYIVRNYRMCRMLSSASGWRFHYMVPKQTACP